jgi:nitroreductase
MNQNDILSALQKRYATLVFDTTKKVSDEDMHTILESARLAPSSFGLEPWKFIVVINAQVRTRIREAAYDQAKVTDSSHLVVIARRTNSEELVAELIERTAAAQGKSIEEFSNMLLRVQTSMSTRSEGAVRDGWIAAQTYIPLGIMVETASLLGIDNGPMEGFNSAQVDEILGLTEQNLISTTMLALGYRGEDPRAALPKTRRSFDEVVAFID